MRDLPAQNYNKPVAPKIPPAYPKAGLKQAFTNRYEVKYLVDARDLPNIKRVLGGLLVPDKNNGNTGGYYNHSIYFDSPGYRYYTEKHEGELNRLKPRLRFYRSSISATPLAAHLELKGRRDRIVIKRRCALDLQTAYRLLESADPGAVLAEYFSEDNNQVANEFIYLSQRYNLKPCVTVLYHREAYFSKLYKNLRVTYDSALLCSLATVPDIPFDSYIESVPGAQVLVEVKYNDQIPRIFLKRLHSLGMQQRTFSKFAVSLERSFTQLRSRQLRAEYTR